MSGWDDYYKMAKEREARGEKPPGLTAANGQLLHLAGSACTRVKEDRRPVIDQLITPGHLLKRPLS
jgi:hypothetical protein